MQDPSIHLRGLPLEAFDAPHPGDAWDRSQMARASDRALIEAVAGAITPPKVRAESSFVLHAPLELLARARLLAHAPPSARPGARRRIAEIAARYAREGPETEPEARSPQARSPQARSYADNASAVAAVAAALTEGDIAAADGALTCLLERHAPSALAAALADAVLPCLGAAAHAPILLAAFVAAPADTARLGGLLRAPIRYLALEAASRLTWPARAPAAPLAAGAAGPAALFEALREPPRVASPSPFIAATMLAVEADGLAERLLAGPLEGLSAPAVERTLLRTAAWSMLQDDPRHAPYGWTHALTLAQGVLALALLARDGRAAARIAATHVLGFRATLGRVRLDPDAPPGPPGRTPLERAPPAEAASIAFHAPPDQHVPIAQTLAARAAPHADAHLVKYTLACLDAAARDPEAAPLFLAAAAWLGAWWDENPDAAFGD
jgi:hypothetical protein